jgi:hypothetical protein
MSYCPNCFTEYREGTSECMDCHVALEKGSPPEQHQGGYAEPKLVRIRTFSGPTALMQADLAKNLLQEQGLLSFVPGETSAEILPGVDVVQLWVREEDAERAADILQSYLDATENSGGSIDEPEKDSADD